MKLLNTIAPALTILGGIFTVCLVMSAVLHVFGVA